MKKPYRTLSALALAAASLAGASVAQAQTAMSNPSGPFTMTAPRAYIGLSAGQTDYRLNGGTGFFSNDSRSTAYSLTGGSYFTNNFGAELAYTDFGRISRAGGTSRGEGVSLRLVGRVPLGTSFNLLGKIGTTYARTDVSSAAGSGIAPGSDQGWGLSMGLGAEYMFSPNWSALLSYDTHDMHFAGGNTDRDRVSVTSLGVRYSF